MIQSLIQLLQEMTIPTAVEGRYELMHKLSDALETLGGIMMKDEQLIPQNMRLITMLKSALSENFSAEMKEVTAEWLKSIAELEAARTAGAAEAAESTEA